MYAQNLRKLRKHLNLSSSRLSEILEIPSRTLLAYERKERTPSIELVVQLSEKLNININWFLTGVGEMFKEKQPDFKNLTPVENYKNWGQRLKSFLADKKISEKDFSKATGIAFSRIEKMLNASIAPTIDEINSIKTKTDISIDWLLYAQNICDFKPAIVLPFTNDEIAKLKEIANVR